MADTFTTNYNLTKVEVGASTNTWGGKLNANFDSIDSDLKSVSDVANAAVPKAGGTMTGFLVLSADPTATNHAATKAYVDANISGGAVPPTRQIATSGFLTGGGDLTANRTLSLGPMAATGRLMGSSSSSTAVTNLSLDSHYSISGTVFGLGNMGGASRLLGSPSSGSGMGDITLGNGLSMSGSVLSASGTFAQIVTASGAGGTTTNIMGTGPTATQGAQFATITFTPTNVNSTFEITYGASLMYGSAQGWCTMGLLYGTTYLDLGYVYSPANGEGGSCMKTFIWKPNTTSPITLNLRAGSAVAGTFTWGGALFNGIIVREILP